MTTEDIPALIAEARNHIEHYSLNDGDALRVSRLADALEAEHARAEFLYQDILFRASDTTEEQS